jgi:NAD(P)-dependent dehydrogenase (short-subunit alcohol dehydrogenase family)
MSCTQANEYSRRDQDTNRIDFGGKLAVVTGSGRALGLAFAKALTQAGAALVVNCIYLRLHLKPRKREAAQAAQAIPSPFRFNDPVKARDLSPAALTV